MENNENRNGTAEKKENLWLLGATFFKIGLFTFGGGYAMLSLIENECVEKHKWITHEEMLDITAVAESTPGPIAINCATYVGFRRGGVLGSVMTTLGVVLPSFIIIYLISLFFENILAYSVVANAFMGIRAAVPVLIVMAAMKMSKKLEKSSFAVVIFAAAVLLNLASELFGMGISVIWLIVAAGLVGYVAYLVSRAKKGGRDE